MALFRKAEVTALEINWLLQMGRRRGGRAATPGSVSVFKSLESTSWPCCSGYFRDSCPGSKIYICQSLRECGKTHKIRGEGSLHNVLNRSWMSSEGRLLVEKVKISVNVGVERPWVCCCWVEGSCVWTLQLQSREQCTAAAAGIILLYSWLHVSISFEVYYTYLYYILSCRLLTS